MEHFRANNERVVWIDATFDRTKCIAVYSDRLYEWDYNKYNRCCREVFGNEGQYFHNRRREDIEKFLSLYFERGITLTAIIQGCNQGNGYPYWVFFYKDVSEVK